MNDKDEAGESIKAKGNEHRRRRDKRTNLRQGGVEGGRLKQKCKIEGKTKQVFKGTENNP